MLPSMSDVAADEAVKALEDFLKGKRLKMTEPRRRLVRAALAQPGHFTAEELHDRLREMGEDVSMATVYRSLAVLEEAGILEGHDFDDPAKRGQRRYERLLAREHHDHMVCLDCRSVVEFQNAAIERLQDRVAREHRFRIREHHLTMFVSCEVLAQKGACPRMDAKRAPNARKGSV
jgi:Fur family ferric uptake transcriptional regulator